MTISHQYNRRTFLHRAGQTGLGVAAAASALSAGRAEAAEKETIRLAFIGMGGRGPQLAIDFAKRGDCRIAYVCDVDRAKLPGRVKEIEQIQGSAPKSEQDFRRALDDKEVDAVVVATPDHWHALATIWACQAGKDVYVEKPVSHSPWEGRKMIEAARKYERIVQVGTQNRSAPYNIAAKKYLDEGKLGRIHFVKVFNQKYIGNVQAVADSPAPPNLDWNMWNGPAEEAKYNANLHRMWNHFWRYSGGDIINDGVHQIDLARWLIGKDYPKSVYSVGGRFNEPGVLDSPDTQTVVYEFDGLMMTFELTLYTPYMLKTDPVVRESDMFPLWPQNATRIEIYGDKGLMLVGRHGGGWQVFDRPKSRQPVVAAQRFGRFPDAPHKENFVQSIRSRKLPSADIEEGHRSTLLCQYANVSYRLGGRKLAVDPKTEQFIGDDEADAMLKREYRSPWIVPETV